MPLIKQSNYKVPFLLRNCHAHTVYPYFFRKVKGVDFIRERIDTPDADFIDLDWSKIGSKSLLLAIHGLEGNSSSKYMPGMIKAFNRRGWDGLAYNLRGCSGEPNRLLRSYHSGDTDDLDTVVQHVLKQGDYTQLAIVGFSLGGNLALKYLGEPGRTLPPELISGAAVSAPCDLESSALQISESFNARYLHEFMQCFQQKIQAKAQMFPGEISDENFHEIKSLQDYDERYTAPIHGFANAKEYWTKCSSRQFLAGIRIPTLLLTALDDPFLREESYPFEEARNSEYLFFETPKFGGHLGFVSLNARREYWHEKRVSSFIIDSKRH